MKKLLLALIVLSATALNSFAQQSSSPSATHLSIGFEAGLPVGSNSTFYSVALGGSLKYEIPIAPATMFGISGGYTSLKAKSDFGGGSFGFVPLKAGLKFYINEGFYGEGQVGASIYTGSGGGTSFIYSPGIGYTLGGGFDLGIRYEGWVKDGTFSQVAVRVAFNIQ